MERAAKSSRAQMELFAAEPVFGRPIEVASAVSGSVFVAQAIFSQTTFNSV
jgi:hypothetical protein